MIVLVEEQEAWSLTMLVSAIAVDNAGLSSEAVEAIRRWRNENGEGSKAMAEMTDAINGALNSHLDAKFMRRVKNRGWYETVRK
jgi:hypothetical protein